MGKEKNSCTQAQINLSNKICAYLSENIGTHITIRQLADKFNVSPTHLKKSFRDACGSSIYAFARSQKMLKAADLLRDTDRKIIDIAGELGYDNSSKFSKAFKDVIGSAPSVFRKKHQI
ncbi:MAG: helix-turn-helix transcriptional regulator [Ruminococcus sp.]|nr:helix-turn-helix transcriptional regulator [Ruminococcus sp.]